MRFRNDSGGLFVLAIPAVDSPLEGAILRRITVDDGEVFDADVDAEGIPLNPSLRMLLETGGVSRSDEKRAAVKRPRKKGPRK